MTHEDQFLGHLNDFIYGINLSQKDPVNRRDVKYKNDNENLKFPVYIHVNIPITFHDGMDVLQIMINSGKNFNKETVVLIAPKFKAIPLENLKIANYDIFLYNVVGITCHFILME